MSEMILTGQGREVVSIPRNEWETGLSRVPEQTTELLSFMTPDHHRVRYFVVDQLARSGRPLRRDFIAKGLGLSRKRVSEILGELERTLFFLVTNTRGEVSWAFPVTADETPHRLEFSSGERLWAAWAVDALATPFVQGRLRSEPLSVTVHSKCGHCGKAVDLRIDSELHVDVLTPGARPFVFHPTVDWARFDEPNILHGFWQKAVFLWSEEHIAAHREGSTDTDGLYLTLEQGTFATRIDQGALFAFGEDSFPIGGQGGIRNSEGGR